MMAKSGVTETFRSSKGSNRSYSGRKLFNQAPVEKIQVMDEDSNEMRGLTIDNEGRLDLTEVIKAYKNDSDTTIYSVFQVTCQESMRTLTELLPYE